MNMLNSVKYKLAEVPQSYWDFAHKHGTIYQSKPYLECCMASGREQLVVIVYDGSEIVGGGAVTVGHRILNFPIRTIMYFGPVVVDKKKVADVLHSIVKGLRMTSLTFSVTVLPEQVGVLSKNSEIANWHKQEIEFLHWDISGSVESLRKALAKGKKSGINRARREGIVIKEIETPEHVEQFFEVYSMSMKKSSLDPGSVLYYKNFITIIRPAGMATGFLALHPRTGKPVAGRILLLGMHQDATFLASGHHPQYRKLRGADLLVWHCIEFLKSKGFVVADFIGLPIGDSLRAQGLRASKLAWTGVYGYRYPSYTLSHGNFGLNPKLVLSTLLFSKKVINFVSGGLRAK
jgi:hypothetical protein